MKQSKHPAKNVISLDHERKKREPPPPPVIPLMERKAKLLTFAKEVERLRSQKARGKTSTQLPDIMVVDLDQFVADVSEQMQTLFRNQKNLDRTLRNAFSDLRHTRVTLSEMAYSMGDLMVRVMNLETENEDLVENLRALMRKHRKLRARYIKAKRNARAQGIEW